MYTSIATYENKPDTINFGVNTDHLGNVRAVVSDIRQPVDNDGDGETDEYQADVKFYADYYPYGMLQPGRSFNAGDYRFGFQGMEADGEIAGVKNSYTAEYWQYDPRIGRRWNVDPILFHSQSSYAAFNNNPIYFIDPLGLQGQGNDDESDAMKVIDEEGNFTDEDVNILIAEVKVEAKLTWKAKRKIRQRKRAERRQKSKFIKFLERLDEAVQGEGGTQPGGWHLYTEDGGMNPTRVIATNSSESIDVTYIFAAFGAKGNSLSRSKMKTKIDKIKSVTSGIDKTADIIAELNKIAQSNQSFHKVTDKYIETQTKKQSNNVHKKQVHEEQVEYFIVNSGLYGEWKTPREFETSKGLEKGFKGDTFKSRLIDGEIDSTWISPKRD